MDMPNRNMTPEAAPEEKKRLIEKAKVEKKTKKKGENGGKDGARRTVECSKRGERFQCTTRRGSS
jgi:hypothetical protein